MPSRRAVMIGALAAGRAPAVRAKAAEPAEVPRAAFARGPAAPVAQADRGYTLNLTAEIAGYIWSINNVVWNREVPPLPVARGERVELIMINRTAMPHPMHLHGHQFQVVEIDGKRFRGGSARHGSGAAGPPRCHRLRRRQSRPMGVPLSSSSIISRPACSQPSGMSSAQRVWKTSISAVAPPFPNGNLGIDCDTPSGVYDVGFPTVIRSFFLHIYLSAG